MSAERRPPEGEPASSAAGKHDTESVTAEAIFAGELASSKYGKLAGLTALPDAEPSTCTGRCQALEISQLLYYGRRYHGCPCRVAGGWAEAC